MTKLEKIIKVMINDCKDAQMPCRYCIHEGICDMFAKAPRDMTADEIIAELNEEVKNER